MSVRQVFADQSVACENLGSPFMGFLCTLLAEKLDRDTAVGKLCLDWPGDPRPSADSIPLRLCGGLHALVLSGRDKALASQYPPHNAKAPDWSVIREALQRHEIFLLDWMTSPPQTNEVSRAGIVWPALMTIVRNIQMPLSILEVGASAGLNLQMDRFGYVLGGKAFGNTASPLRLEPEWRGAVPQSADVSIVDRAACDINPLDPGSDADVLRLRSYIWPDQAARRQRFDHAVTLAKAYPVPVERADAVVWLEKRLSTLPRERCTVIYSTVAWQYLPQEARTRGEAVINDAAQRADRNAPLAWLRFEADGQTPGAGIRLQLWPDNSDLSLGRGDFHGRWVDWAA